MGREGGRYGEREGMSACLYSYNHGNNLGQGTGHCREESLLARSCTVLVPTHILLMPLSVSSSLQPLHLSLPYVDAVLYPNSCLRPSTYPPISLCFLSMHRPCITCHQHHFTMCSTLRPS